MYQTVKSNSLYLGVVEQITRAVLTGQLQPGDRLPTESELVEQFGVSRTVIREAIKALSIQGLVEASAGRGTFLTQPPMETIINNFHLRLQLGDHSFDDLLVARRILEVPIARLAAEKAQPENIAKLGDYLEAMRNTLTDFEAFIEHDTAFHAELANATQNIVLNVLIQPIITMLQASRQIAVRVPGITIRALEYHERLLEAVANKDGAAAEQTMVEHLAQVAIDTARSREDDSGSSHH